MRSPSAVWPLSSSTFRYWGESGGEPRQYESASAKIEDVRAAVRYLCSRPDVDSEGVGALGVCFGAGHVVAASIGDPKIRSLATVAAWLHDRESLLTAFGPEYWTEGNHTDFYDRAPFVARAADAVAAHFGRTSR